MKRLIVTACVCVVAASVAGGAAAARAGCSSDASYRLTLSRLVFAADFLGTVQQVQGWESKGLYDRVGPQFRYQASAPMASLPTACTASASFAAAAGQAAVLRSSIHRLAVQFAGFPARSAATKAQWRAALATAMSGSVAAMRLADTLGGLTVKRGLIAAEMKTLTAAKKALG